eukprot:jgi/Botrbrau1/6235/Bobra.0109s0030.1
MIQIYEFLYTLHPMQKLGSTLAPPSLTKAPEYVGFWDDDIFESLQSKCAHELL